MNRSIVLGSCAALAFLLIFLIPPIIKGTDEGVREASLLIPISYAETRHDSAWTDEVRKAFLTDPNNRWPLSDTEAAQRRQVGLLRWLPANAQCKYLSQLVSVLEQYPVNIGPKEFEALVVRRQQCYTQFQ